MNITLTNKDADFIAKKIRDRLTSLRYQVSEVEKADKDLKNKINSINEKDQFSDFLLSICNQAKIEALESVARDISELEECLVLLMTGSKETQCQK